MTEEKSKVTQVIEGIEVILGAVPYVGPMIAKIWAEVKRKEELTDEEWEADKALTAKIMAGDAWKPDGEEQPPAEG